MMGVQRDSEAARQRHREAPSFARWLAFPCLAVTLSRCFASSDGIHLRAGEAPPAGQVIAVDSAGVHLGPAPADGKTAVATLVVPWDRIAAVEGNADAGKYTAIAEDAWRARTRIERSDYISAEPLLERLFGQYKNQRGATASLVAEGLLRCRLRRGAHVLAIEPWLALLRAGAPPKVPALHEAWAEEAGLSPVIDPGTGLIPALPPMWLSWPAVDSFAKGADPTPPAGTKTNATDARADALSQIYYQAARFESGLVASLPELATSDPGVNIAWQVVQARIGTPEQRDAARKLLRDRLRPTSTVAAAPPWLEVWIHAALGRSLIREDATELKQAGIIELLTIPARSGRTHPYLCGLALAEASTTLRALGDAPGADMLARELASGFPSHPVNDWTSVRAARPKVAPPAPPAPRTDLPPDPQTPPPK